MDLDSIIFEIQKKEAVEEMPMYEKKLGWKDGKNFKNKLRVAIKQCPECPKNFVPTDRSPDICLFCWHLHNRQRVENVIKLEDQQNALIF